MPIESGIQAPDFSLPDESNLTRRLSDFRGRPVVLYFYPKDDTPGCTTEACNFRDDYSAYIKADLVVLGVSPDSVKSHAKFKEKYSCRFRYWRITVTKFVTNMVFGDPKNLQGVNMKAYCGRLF